VNLQSPIDSRDLICPVSGRFTINISVPKEHGSHVIEGTSTDPAKNLQTHSIHVLKQDWSEWAIEDARGSGPMLWWLLAAGIASSSALLLVTMRAIRTRNGR
jgi:hypothetical protein